MVGLPPCQLLQSGPREMEVSHCAGAEIVVGGITHSPLTRTENSVLGERHKDDLHSQFGRQANTLTVLWSDGEREYGGACLRKGEATFPKINKNFSGITRTGLPTTKAMQIRTVWSYILKP